MKIGVLIPTQNTRPSFMKHCMYLLSKQTLQPDFIKVVDDYTGMKYDLTWRYKKGLERLKKKGADVVIFWEEDDWYSPYYIEKMVSSWVNNGKPDVFGLASTIYYHIGRNEYKKLIHPGRASMMSTIVNANIDISGFRDAEVFLDLSIWNDNRYKKLTASTMDVLALGIKHGEGNCGGNGHNDNFKYSDNDNNLKFLSSIVDEKSLKFYKEWHIKNK